MNRVIFLDIDGPLIPGERLMEHPHASMERNFCPECVQLIKELAHEYSAQIVMNTTHNLDGDRLLEDLVKYGFEEFLHEEWQTEFPGPAEADSLGWYQGICRYTAIQQWLEVNDNPDWIALDDTYFTEDDKLILVQFELGVDEKTSERVHEIWG